MGTIPSPSAEKKRTKTSRRGHPFRNAFLKPKIWKTAVTALDFILKAVRVGAQIWDMLT